MAGQTYTTFAGRTEKHKARVLVRAQIEEQLSKVGAVEPMPQNSSENVEWLEYLPYGGVRNEWIAAGGDTVFVNKHIVQDGVTPEADSITATTVSATMQHIGCLYSYTKKTRVLHEEGEHIPKEQEDQSATRIVLCKEMLNYGELKGCTNSYFGGVGTSVATTNGPPTRTMFQKVTRTILGKHGGLLRSLLKSGMNYGSQGIQASFIGYCHTDMIATFENTVGFTLRKDYGNPADVVDENEIGTLGQVRICTNPILTYYVSSGAAVATWTGNGSGKSTDASSLDIYPIIIMGKGKAGGDAFGQVALRGLNSLDVGHIPVGTKSPSDPLGLHGYVSAQTWHTQKILNDAWMAVCFVGTEDL